VAAHGGSHHPKSKLQNYKQYYTQKKAHEVRNNFIPWGLVGLTMVWPDFARTRRKTQVFSSLI
jgi:hypothetical protein